MNEGIPQFEDSKKKISKIEVERNFPPDDIQEPLWIDFDSGGDFEMGIKGPDIHTYVISPVSEANLFSDKYINCTGVVGFGRSKDTGKEIAFISHQDPEYFLNRTAVETENFVNDLKGTLNDLLAQAEEGTVEVVLFGGNDDADDLESKKTVEYTKSMELLSKVVESCTRQAPVIIGEANHQAGSVDVTILTQERKIFIA